MVIGKAKIIDGSASYHLEVLLKDAPTLAAQSEREPYEAPAALDDEPRWYAGDFHVHSLESGDARPPNLEAAGVDLDVPEDELHAISLPRALAPGR